MNCIRCRRNAQEVMLFKLPLETKYSKVHMQVVGNCTPNEFMCLPCVGYEYDEVALGIEQSAG